LSALKRLAAQIRLIVGKTLSHWASVSTHFLAEESLFQKALVSPESAVILYLPKLIRGDRRWRTLKWATLATGGCKKGAAGAGAHMHARQRHDASTWRHAS
jgi:hypothetical protein